MGSAMGSAMGSTMRNLCIGQPESTPTRGTHTSVLCGACARESRQCIRPDGRISLRLEREPRYLMRSISAMASRMR